MSKHPCADGERNNCEWHNQVSLHKTFLLMHRPARLLGADRSRSRPVRQLLVRLPARRAEVVSFAPVKQSKRFRTVPRWLIAVVVVLGAADWAQGGLAQQRPANTAALETIQI